MEWECSLRAHSGHIRPGIGLALPPTLYLTMNCSPICRDGHMRHHRVGVWRLIDLANLTYLALYT